MSNELPYLPFFVGDFLVAVGTWPAERVGAYVLALCYQFEQGGIPADDAGELAGIFHVSKSAARRLWAEIQQKNKFHRRSDGLWWNQRLEEVRAFARAQVATASERGRRGASARWGKGANSAQAIPAPANAQALLEQSASNGIQTKVRTEPPKPPAVAGGRKRRGKASLTSDAEMDHIRKSQRVRELKANGMEHNAAIREVFGS